MKPVVHLYTICWNEEDLLHHFFDHYDAVVDRYIFYDDGSTDETLAILAQHPKVVVRSLPRLNQDSYVLAAKELHNSCWKESRGIADWVIYTAVDEFLYAPQGLGNYLKECKEQGVTAIPALGYQMVSDTFPIESEPILLQVKNGCPWSDMNKLSIFNPNEISESNFHAGRHLAEPQGNIVFPKSDVLLNLHCKYLNFEKTFQRHTDLNIKLGLIDKENGWGFQYGWSRDKFKEDWDFFKQNSHENILADNYFPALEHSITDQRWWRPSWRKRLKKYTMRWWKLI